MLRALMSACVLALLLAPPASAAPGGRSAERESRIAGQLRAIAPDAVPKFEQATAAMDRGDDAAGVQGFREVLTLAPQFTPAMRRLGGTLIHAGNVREGLSLLQQAVAVDRSPENLFSLAQGIAFPSPSQESSQT